MPAFRIRARPPRGAPSEPALDASPDLIHSFLEDAAHYPGGHAAGVAFARTEADVAGVLRRSTRVLPVGAQSSLTGGATPMGDAVLSLSRMNRVTGIGTDWVRVESGVPLVDLQAELARHGRSYPPVPTFTGAFVGGIIATNAAGAATFKYGSTRAWVRAITIVLAGGDVLDVVRGEVVAHPDGYFDIETAAGTARVPVPGYHMPDVPKRSAGYHAEPGMDLIDLFIGSEGTLGVVTEATLRVLERPPVSCWALVPVDSEAQGLQIVAALRDRSIDTRRTADPRGIDVSAIEHLDRRCLRLLVEDGHDRRCGVAIPDGAALALLVQLELAAGTTAERAYDEIGRMREADAPDTPLVRFARLLDEARAFDRTELVMPGDTTRAEQLFALREAVPTAVRQRIGAAKRAVHPEIEKTAADMIVPFPRFSEMMALYRRAFERRGLDYAVWGHISDGNVHPNVIPRSIEDVRAGQDAIRELGREVVRMGGCPLAEHGVGRSPVKQALLTELYGQAGIEQMRAVKRALDPGWKLSPGVLFPMM